VNRQLRLIYNQDCTNLFGVAKEPLQPRHVDRMVDEAADGGVDLFLVNPNAQRVNYPSRVWQTFWDGYAPGDPAFFGPVPDSERPKREAWVRQMKNLADQGCNYLARALARCRTRGIMPGVTVRMNDMHDVPYPGSHLFSSFYLGHPELRLDNPPVCGWSAKGLDYQHEAVREHYLALVRELAADYDFDALELDFLRFHCYFARNDFERHAGIMTGFVRDVRRILDTRGRRVLLTARVPSTPASAFELGLDLAAWAGEGLVDAVAPAAFLNTAWCMSVDEFRRVTGGKVAVWPCAEASADRPEGLRTRALPACPDLLRGFAAGYLAAGADALEFFNFFTTREEAVPVEPRFDVLRELRDRDSLRGRPKAYTVTSGWALAETDGPLQVPAHLPPNHPRAFSLLLAAEPPDAAVRIEVLAEGPTPTAEQLWLHVNQRPAGSAASVQPWAESKPGLHLAVFRVPADALRDGPNTLVLRSEASAALTVRSIDVCVG
jgi:hypothetical protein